MVLFLVINVKIVGLIFFLLSLLYLNLFLVEKYLFCVKLFIGILNLINMKIGFGNGLIKVYWMVKCIMILRLGNDM